MELVGGGTRPFSAPTGRIAKQRKSRKQRRRRFRDLPPRSSGPHGGGEGREQRRDDAHEYLQRYVDPLVTSAVSFMLMEQPGGEQEIDAILLRHLKHMASVDAATGHQEGLPKAGMKRKARSSDRLFAARTMAAPIFTKLIGAALASRPENVLTFFIEAIEGKVTNQVSSSDGSYAAERDCVKATAGTSPADPLSQQNVKKNITVLVIGIDGAGKSTMISTLRGVKNPQCKPSLGFCPISMKYGSDGNTTIKFYDLGGGEKIRGIWSNYFHDVHGIIYVLDSSCEDAKFDEAVEVAKSTLGHKYLQGKPLLVFCNKADIPSRRQNHTIGTAMNLNVKEGGRSKVLGVSLHPQRKECGGKRDSALDEGLEWLIEKVLSDFDGLDQRVVSDTKKEAMKRKKAEMERERRVMKTSLCKAFGIGGEEKTDVYEKGEAEEFLAQEIGLEHGGLLPPEGREVVSMVGYQKLALMMIGGMIAPISKQKPPWTWVDVKKHVQSIRSEIAGIS